MKKTSVVEINGWLHALHEAASSGHLSCPTFLKPYHLVTLALFLKRENARWLELSPEIESYALRMGLWAAADIIPPYEMQENATQNRFLPVVPLKDPESLPNAAKNLSHLVYQQNLGSESFESVEIMLMELIENTYKHARVTERLHGLVCAQVWARGNLAQVVFADSGIGIRASLRENEQLRSKLQTHNACELACYLGITSKPKAHSGYGLALTNGLIEQSRGNMMVISNGEGYFKSGAREITFQGGPWCGTLILLEWPINHPLNVKPIYDSWPLPEGFNINDFNND